MDKLTLIEPHVRVLYKALRHAGYLSLVHCQDMTSKKTVNRRLVNGEEEFVKWAKEFNGRGNLFVGRNPRSKEEAVECVTSFTIDIDPVRPKDTASSGSQLAEAFSVSRRVLASYPGGSAFCSGNGTQILYAWPEHRPQDKEAFRKQCAAITDRIRASFATANVEIDSVHDLERLMKIVGSTSMKGGERRSYWLSPDNVLQKDGTHMLNTILAADTKPSVPIKGNGDIDRSSADFAFAIKCKMLGYGPSQTYDALLTHAFRPGREDDYKRIVDKLYDNEETEAPSVLTAPVAIEEYKKRLEERRQHPTPELPTGFPSIDAVTWGYKRGSIFTVAARPAIGKTSWALNSLVSLCKAGRRVLMFSTEMDYAEICDRLASIVTGVPAFQLSFMGKGGKELDGFFSDFEKWDLHISDSFEPTFESVARIVEGVKPDVFIFDHLQHTGTSLTNRVQELSAFIKGVKRLARQQKCAALIVSQLNRMAEHEVPALHHLAECGTLEQESSVAILMANALADGVDAAQVPVKFHVAKNRFGPKATANLMFDKPHSKFVEV